MIKPEEFKEHLMKSLSLGTDPSELGKHYDTTLMNFDLLKSQLELVKTDQESLLKTNDELRRSNGDLLLKISVPQSAPEPEPSNNGIDDLLANLKI